jgi:hypothetical protein
MLIFNSTFRVICNNNRQRAEKMDAVRDKKKQVLKAVTRLSKCNGKNGKCKCRHHGRRLRADANNRLGGGGGGDDDDLDDDDADAAVVRGDSREAQQRVRETRAAAQTKRIEINNDRGRKIDSFLSRLAER